MCFINPLHDRSNLYPEEFDSFIGNRCRAYFLSGQPTDTPIAGRRDRGCNCYASGEDTNAEDVMPNAQANVLAFLNAMTDQDVVEADNMVPETVIEYEDPWAEES